MLSKTFLPRLSGVLLVFLTFQWAQAQVVTISPRFPKITDSLVITFDATQGNAGLLNFAGDVYLHSGVVTGGPNSTGWSNVPMAWGSTDSRWRMTRISTNRYQIRIRPTVFYNVSPSATVYRLGFVFRNGSGSLTGKTSSGGDIFMPIYQPGQQAVSFLGLESRFFLLNLNQVFSYQAASNFQANLRVFVDGAEVASAQNDTFLQGNLPTATGGTKKVILRADGVPTLADSFTVRINQANTVQDLPSGVEDGINVLSPTSAILCLRAPGKSNVYCIGEFNNWELTDQSQMKQTPDGKFWWIELNNLDPSREYTYQYFVDGTLRIADPYSKIILNRDDDGFINSSIYPGLKPYPVGKTTGNVSVFRTGEPAFNWQNTSFRRPDKKDLVVYELLIRDFANVKTYKNLADSLGYFKKLGINCIQLMPIMEFEGNLSWGYNPSHHYALDKYYGSATAFKEFVDKAHGMCISVVLDIALNHAFGQSPMVQLYWDAAQNRPAANSPWFNTTAKHPANVGYDFNHDSPDTRYYVDRVLKFWLDEYKIDGFRFDLSKGFTQRNACVTQACTSSSEFNSWSLYDASRVALWKSIYNDIQSYSPCAYVILEHFANNNEETELANYGMMFWGNINYNYTEAVMGWPNTSDLSWGYYRNRGWTKPHLISYMESHDEERMMYKSLQFGNTSQAGSGYRLRDTSNILNRYKLASCFFYTVPGPKMIWQFGELGYGFSINFPCAAPCTNGANRTGPKPIRWDYLQEARRRSLWDVTRSLIALKRFEPVFGTEPSGPSVNLGNTPMKRISLTHSTRNVVVLGNFGVTSGNITPNFPASGRWYEFFTGDSLQVDNPTEPMELQRGEYRIYSNRKWLTPAAYLDLLANATCIVPPGTDACGNILGTLELKDETQRIQVFPNPGTGLFTFVLPFLTEGQARVSIVDLSGRVRFMENAEMIGGSVVLNLESAGLPSGLYGVRMAVGSKNYFTKLMIQR